MRRDMSAAQHDLRLESEKPGRDVIDCLSKQLTQMPQLDTSCQIAGASRCDRNYEPPTQLSLRPAKVCGIFTLTMHYQFQVSNAAMESTAKN
jgi:hypothetical protein